MLNNFCVFEELVFFDLCIPVSAFRFPDSGFRIPDSGFLVLGLPFQERTLLLLYLHALRYIVPLLLYCTKLGYFFLELTKGALSQDGGITRLIRTGISNIN